MTKGKHFVSRFNWVKMYRVARLMNRSIFMEMFVYDFLQNSEE